MVNLVGYLGASLACSSANRNYVTPTDPLTLPDQYTLILSEIDRKDTAGNSKFPQLLRNRYQHSCVYLRFDLSAREIKWVSGRPSIHTFLSLALMIL